MKAYDLYGVNAASLESAKDLVGRLLSISFEAHDSSYLGDYFLGVGDVGESFKVRENLDPLDDEPAETEFTEHRFLLFVDGSDRSELLRTTLEGDERVALLRHELL